MGIKQFFSWFRKKFRDNIYHLRRNETIGQLRDNNGGTIVIDNLLVDMNGIFHTSAQKIYQYGDYKPPPRLLGPRSTVKPTLSTQIAVYKDVCRTIEQIVTVVQPTKRLILCVDGPAPLSKQQQQRSRRFVSAMERTGDGFDSNSITPGTKFMDYLSKYIDWFIRNKISFDPEWAKLEIIFSNEKAPGEGEHKLFNYVRTKGNRDESFCIHGMDADLIMLCLGTHFPRFYILREDRQFDHDYFIDIAGVRQDLSELMRFDCGEKSFLLDSAINDFILMCFTVGNDFLPHIPGIEIIEGGIDFMLDIYKQVGQAHGHLTGLVGDRIRFRRRSLASFLQALAKYEGVILAQKMAKKDNYFPDHLLEEAVQFVSGESKDGLVSTKIKIDLPHYRQRYYETNLANIDKTELCHAYLEGMQWVLSYYIHGVSNWQWRYPYHYAPFAHDLCQHLFSFEFPRYPPTTPSLPFVQLLCVLPPKSAQLLPGPLADLISPTDSPLSDYCPEKFPIDLSGKRQTWEGTVILPLVDYELVQTVYRANIHRVDQNDRRRNVLGQSYIYQRGDHSYLFRSFYGDFTCMVETAPIDL